MITKMNLKAFAKINLSLDVLGTLPNGYHEVCMVMQSIDVFDKVNLYRNHSGKINVKTNLSFLPTGPDNLVYKAAKLLMDEFHIEDGLDIDLYKYIPVAAGLAGGSSDAAAVLRGMNVMFELHLTDEELMERGAKLGADIPYCIMGGTALAEGIGEKLTKLSPCPKCYVVLAKPGISVSTKYVYDHLILDENTVHPNTQGMLAAIEGNDIAGVCACMDNVLETVTKQEYPVIGQLEELMLQQGAMNAMMSGSGPTVFGLFATKKQALTCSELLRQNELARSCYVAELVEQEAISC